jgi:putative effector of murein hydrolase
VAFGCQLAGELIVAATGLAVPGPVCGMALLFAGLAIGTASHGIGTARALQVNELAGAFAGLAMGLNALATAILLPLLWHLFF